jgi:predicted ATPase
LVETEEADTDRRYRLLETVRDYAAAKLDTAGEIDSVRRCHALFFAGRSAKIGAGIATREGVRWHQQLDADLADIEVAVRWALERRDQTLAISLVAPLAEGVLP